MSKHKRIKRQIATIDCETDPFKYMRIPSPFIWGFYNGEEFKKFFSLEGILDYFENTKQKYLMYAHNGGKFDFFFMLSHAAKQSTIKIINGRIAEFKIGENIFRDSILILPVPLSAINKDDFDYSKLEEMKRAHYMDDIVAYLESDCVNLYNAVIAFTDRFGRKLTVPGAAMSEWKKVSGLFIPESSVTYFEQFKPFYFGGRVTPFESGVIYDDFKIYDINSAYPWAMKNYYHPYGTSHYEAKNVKEKYWRQCFFHIKADSFGALPVRGKNGTDFPYVYNTEFRCTGHELIAGLETDTVRNVEFLSTWHFTDCYNFEEYIDKWYSERLLAKLNDNMVLDLHGKLMMNSLYGRFGINPTDFREYIVGDYGDPPPEDYDIDICMDDVQIFSKPIEDSKKHYCNVATSASITGAVRAMLWESILKCSGVVYCDTDSAICRNGDALKLSNDLGDWKLEGTGDKIAIAGKKLYALWEGKEVVKIASKGVRITADELEKVALGEVVTFKPEVPTFSLSSGINFTDRRVRRTC